MPPYPGLLVRSGEPDADQDGVGCGRLVAHLLIHYALTVKHSGEPQLLGDFSDGHRMQDFLGEALGSVDEVGDERQLATAEPVHVDGSHLDVVLEVGEAGVRSQLRKGETLVDRLPEDAEVLRAFALFHVPPGARRGNVVIHQPHGRGIKGLLLRALKARFNEVFPPRNLALEIAPAVPAEELRRLYEQGAVQRIRLTRHQTPADGFNELGDYAAPEEVGAVETHIVSSRGGALHRRGPRLEQVVDRTVDGDLLIFEGVTYDEMRVDLDIGDRRKTIVVHPELSSGNLSYDVTGELEYVEGDPTRDSLRAAARRLLEGT